MDYFINWTWQDYLVAAALVLAVSFLWRTRIAPRFRREPQGCDKCAVSAPRSGSKSQIIDLTDDQAKRLRREIGADGSSS